MQIKSLTDYPEYKEELAKKHRLIKEMEELVAQRDKLRFSPDLTNGTDEVTVAAESLINGDVSEAVISLGDRIKKNEERQTVVKRALVLLEERLRTLRNKISTDICKDLKPHYVSMVNEVAAAGLAFSEAIEREYNFRQELIRKNIAFTISFPPESMEGIGRLDLFNSPLAQFFRRAKEQGYLSKELAAKIVSPN